MAALAELTGGVFTVLGAAPVPMHDGDLQTWTYGCFPRRV
jgi:hypothetical protein